MATSILLLEDDINLGEIVKEYLEDENYEVFLVDNAKDALDKAFEKNFDIWILDVKVPKGDGFSILKELRNLNKNTPAIFMTSLNTIDDVKNGFQSGCDDYIKKPFELAELSLRIKTLIKRSFSHKKDDFEDLGSGFKFFITNQILYKEDKIISLPKKELKLLTILLKNKDGFISIEDIFDQLWDFDESPSELSLRAYIKNLRKLFGKDSIINERGRGYRYVRS